ncbi:DNA polymerase I [Euzebya pacifica]|uniref:DNA polymerase I n=1 Tax=Euzebya pacifica TaxID=1608957 RepID=A0A346XXV7_9ACTN|nr:DNA polymerase I [Euzebya pacifica]AXV07054.1 DNA polymerase I [Euzebya pacifica]
MTAPRPTLALLDGYSLAYRAFFALPEDLRTTTGQVTNAAYGFTSMVIKLLDEHPPEALAAVFDKGRPAERTELLPEYKANRKKSPDEFKSQLPLIDEVLEAMGIPRVDLEGQEADDLIASYAETAKADGWDVLVVTGDRDLFQLVDEGDGEHGAVRVLYTRRGISDTIVMDTAAVEDKYGVPPTSYPMLAALRGDPSDNIPGVPGVGDKTASKLLAAHGTLEGIYDNIEQIRGKKVPAMLLEHRDAVMASRIVTTVNRQLPLPRPVEDFRRGEIDAPAVQRLFATLEFRSLWDRLNETVLGAQAEEAAGGFDNEPHRGDTGEIAAWLGKVPGGQPVAVVPTTAGSLPAVEAVAIALAASGADPITARTEVLGEDDRVAVQRLLSGTDDHPLWVHDGKKLHHFARAAGFDEPTEPMIDTEVWAYVLQPSARTYALDKLALEYLSKHLATEEEVQRAGEESGQLGMFETEQDTAWRARAFEAQALFELAEVLDAEVTQRGQADLIRRIELPLIAGLADLERAGITVDGRVLAELGADLEDKVADARSRALVAVEGDERDLEDFQDLGFLDSPKKLQSLLFEHLGLKKTKKIKTGWSTDAAELRKIVEEHPVIQAILDYREYSKLKGTYIDPLLAMVGADRTRRVHAEFNQTVAVTGRLSSQNPNLQNIPIRTELGRQIRRAFVPGEGYDTLVVADYSQIELRVMAHLSGDEGLLDAFGSGEDIHAATAAKVFGVDVADVDNTQRSKIKGMTYGLAYGLSSFGLAQQLSIGRDEAQELMDAYFERFPGVRSYLYGGVEEARRSGYTETLTGRRRYLPDLMSENRQRRAMAERMALNAPIQGTAADIMKIAMNDVRAAMATADWAGDPAPQLLLQVHDELVCEATTADHDQLRDLLVDTMSGVIELAVPLEVDWASGPSWAEAEKH